MYIRRNYYMRGRNCRHDLVVACLGLLVVVSLACADSTAPDTGSIHAVIQTTGSSIDIDADGYSLSVDGGPSRIVSTNTGVPIVAFENVAPGTHIVRLDGVASNCAVTGENPQSVSVGAGSFSAAVSFAVACAPNTGSIRITTVTSGVGPSARGYTVNVAGVISGGVPANGVVIVPGIRAGRSDIMLTGISEECVVDGTNRRSVEIAFRDTVDAGFALRCASLVDLTVSITTSGAEGQPGIIEIRRAGSSARTLLYPRRNDTVTAPGLVSGDYLLTVFNGTANCDVIGPNPKRITLGPGNTASSSFDAECKEPLQLAYVSGEGSFADIQVVNSDGREPSRLITEAGFDGDPAWSPDGRRIAFASDRSGNREIYVMDLDGGDPVRLTNTTGSAFRPAWSPDGLKIAFVVNRGENDAIYVMNADGSGQTRLATNTFPDRDPAWSPDGTRIVFATRREGLAGLYVMAADGSAATRLTTAPVSDIEPAWSPDGKRIAFTRVGWLGGQVFTINADGSGLSQFSSGYESAVNPAWSPDGKKIAFIGVEGGFYYNYPVLAIVSVEGVPYSSLSTPRPVSNPVWRSR